MNVIRETENTKVIAIDEPGEGGDCREYSIVPKNITFEDGAYVTAFAGVVFQKGPIKENGVNGCQIEDLLSVCIHRLMGFQNGPFPCNENHLAKAHLLDALEILNQRTKDRKERGVEGTYQR